MLGVRSIVAIPADRSTERVREPLGNRRPLAAYSSGVDAEVLMREFRWRLMLLCWAILLPFAIARADDAEGVTFSRINPNPQAVRQSVERGTFDVVCDPNWLFEFDPQCGGLTDPNGGCGSIFEQFSPIDCGLTVCGTSKYTGNERDTDWYQITVTQQQQLTFRVTAEFRVVAGLVAGTNGIANCALATNVNPFSIANAGQVASVTVCLPPGTWWFFVAPDFDQPTFACGEQYQAELLCESPCPGGACCFSPAGCQIVESQAACLQLGGRYLGENSFCSANSCASPSNDACSAPITLSCGQTVIADLRNATVTPTEPQSLCSISGVGSVWYRITGTGQPIEISACNASNVDPLALDLSLAVFTGDCPLNLVNENCATQGCGPTNLLTKLCFPTNVGVQYLIQVLVPDDAARARYQLSVTCPCALSTFGACCLPLQQCTDVQRTSCENLGGIYRGDGTTCQTVQGTCPLNDLPANDDCDTAQVIQPASVTNGSTIFAGIDTINSCGLTLQSGGVWYRVTGNGRSIKASTCDAATTFDSQLRVYCNNCSSGIFTCVAANEDGPGACSARAELTWCSQSGAVYYIFVSGYQSQTGNFKLTLSDAGACSNPVFCAGECSFNCPPGGVLEGETFCFDGYVDTTNSGCGSSPESYGSITPGQTLCGFSGTYLVPGGVGRDTDWFTFTIPSRSTVTWTVKAQFLVQAAILNDTCGAQQAILASATGNACQNVIVSVVLDPGTYRAFLSPQFFSGVDCGSNWTATLTAVATNDNGACCFFDCPKCRIVPESQCIPEGGLFWGGAGSTCAQLGNCIPCPGDLNNDNVVDGRDLSVLLAAFGSSAAGDLNCDGLTAGSDLSVFLANFGNDCAP